MDSPKEIPNPLLLLISSIALLLIAICYVIASVLELPLSFVALGGAATMAAISFAFRRLSVSKLVKRISWSVFVFIAGMFVVVKAVEDLGFTAGFGNALLKLAGGNPFASVLLVAGGTAIGSNLINNVPMSLVMVSAVRNIPPSSPGYLSLPFPVMFGAEPNLTTVGSLATMLWLLILLPEAATITNGCHT